MRDWNKDSAGLGCICVFDSRPTRGLGAGPLCNIGATIDKRYLKRMRKLLSGSQRFAAIKFRGIKTRQQFIYFANRELMKTHLDRILDVVINLRNELKSRGLLKTA